MAKVKKPLISLVIPVLNEEGNLNKLYSELKENLKGIFYEIIFINDGSEDASEKIINNLRRRDNNLKLINLSRNFGHQMAITCGIDYANGDAAIIMDADLQDPPNLIPKFIKKWQEGYDVVYAVRKQREGEKLFKLLSASFFYSIINHLSGTKIPQNVGDFRLISRNIIDVIRQTREHQRFLRGMISWAGYPQIGIEYQRAKRFSGSSKYTLVSMTRLAIDAILSFSFFPLRIASYIGIATAIGAVLFIFYALYVQSKGITVKGWSSTIVIILFLGSVQLIAIGIIGEYMGRIYEEIKKRPLYIIRSTTGIKK